MPQKSVHYNNARVLLDLIQRFITRSKEKFVFWDKDVSNIDVDLFLSLFYELQFDDRCYIFSQTPPTFVFGVVYS